MTEVLNINFEQLKKYYPEMSLIKEGSNYIIAGRINRNAIYGGVTLKLDFTVEISGKVGLILECPKAFASNRSIALKFHTNIDGSLCLGAPYEVDKKFRDNPTLIGFVEDLLVPFLFSYEYKRKFGGLPYGDRSHGAKGILESYQDLFRVKSTKSIIEFLEIIANRRYRGHWLCPCGSGKSIRNCHKKIILELMLEAQFYNFSIDIDILKAI